MRAYFHAILIERRKVQRNGDEWLAYKKFFRHVDFAAMEQMLEEFHAGMEAGHAVAEVLEDDEQYQTDETD